MGVRLGGRSFASMETAGIGTGSPDAVVQASLGTLRFDANTGTLYRNTDGNTAWALVTPGSGSGVLQLGATALASPTHNWLPAGYAGEDVVTLANNVALQITGFALGAHQIDGKTITIMQVGANALTFAAENAGSTAANRIRTTAPGGALYKCHTFRYSGITQRWLHFATS